MLNWIPEVYDTERVLRVIGDDGKPDLVTVNERQQQQQLAQQGIPTMPPGNSNPDKQAAEEVVKNNITVGEYDVVMDTGPGHNTKRAEAVDALLSLASSNEKIIDIAGDLIVRNMDFPGSDVVADRLAASNPLAQIDEKSDIPPAAQMMIKQLQVAVQQGQQKMQAMEMEAKYRLMPAQMKAESDAAWMRLEAAKAHDADQTKRHDIAVRASTAFDIESLKSQVDLAMQGQNVSHETRLAVMDALSDQAQREHEAAQSDQDRDLQALSQLSAQGHQQAMAQPQGQPQAQPQGMPNA
jgi:hypothetical protein